MAFVAKQVGSAWDGFKKNFELAMEKERDKHELIKRVLDENFQPGDTRDSQDPKNKFRGEMRSWLETERDASLRRSRRNNVWIVIMILIIFLFLLSFIK